MQLLILGSQIFGKALLEAGRQAVKSTFCLVSFSERTTDALYAMADAKYRPIAGNSDAAGIGRATSGSITDTLTRDHRMTLDEAHLILNVKRGDSMESILEVKTSHPPH